MSELPLESWPPRLDALLENRTKILRHAHVVRTTTSTQDTAVSLGLGPGAVIIAGRQTAGRGRQGRDWADTNDDGVAMTIVIDARPPELLSIACAVGVSAAAESLAGTSIDLKWPNDIYARERKLAGILVEQSMGLADGLARIGVGINVNQTAWPDDLAERAISLRQVRDGGPLERLDVVEALLVHVDEALRRSPDRLETAFRDRDMLVGRVASFQAAAAGGGHETLTGEVVALEPTRGLAVRAGGGEVRWLPAATTTVVGF